MIIIENWFGRFGNNILQILRAVHYGIINNHDKIVFPPHSLLYEALFTI